VLTVLRTGAAFTDSTVPLACGSDSTDLESATVVTVSDDVGTPVVPLPAFDEGSTAAVELGAAAAEAGIPPAFAGAGLISSRPNVNSSSVSHIPCTGQTKKQLKIYH
jgi:hypothetical protein